MIIGKGKSYAIAKEGYSFNKRALKIKEVTYIHADPYMAAEMKHGPIALINSEQENLTKGIDTILVILIILDDNNKSEMENALSQVKSRKAYTIVITDCLHKLDIKKIDQYCTINNLKVLILLLGNDPTFVYISLLKNCKLYL